jgi:hypothetical protein
MARARHPRAEPSADFSDIDSAGGWFATQPREVCVALAARAALRVLPLIRRAKDAPSFATRVLLPALRAAVVSWTAAELPAHAGRFRDVAYAAGAAATFYATEATAAHTARAAAVAAYAADAGTDDDARTAAEAAAAHAADADDDADAATRADAIAIEQGRTVGQLVAMPLWIGGQQMPEPIAVAWTELRRTLLAAGDDWDVWVRWYQDRLDGRPSLGEAFDLAVATLPNDLWEQGPRAVNARIKELIAEHTPPDPIPAQGAGPHFALGAAGPIAFAAPSDIDAVGNNSGRISQLLPVQRSAVNDLAGQLTTSNAFAQLASIVGEYGEAIAGDETTIAWGTVFGLGLRLENAAQAARRDIDDRMKPALEDPAQEALDTVVALHGPLILASAEGRELTDEADRMRLTREEQAARRKEAAAIADALRSDPEVIEPGPGEFVGSAAEAMGTGPHPERGTVFGLATVKNVLILVAGVGAISAIAGIGFVEAGAALVAVEGLKKSRSFSALTGSIGDGVDRVVKAGPAFRRFVVANETPLRQIASNTTSMRWLVPYIDRIVNANRRTGGG